MAMRPPSLIIPMSPPWIWAMSLALGYQDVEQDEVGRDGGALKRLGPAGRRVDVVFAAEEFGQDVDVRLRVIHHQNLCARVVCHVSPCAQAMLRKLLTRR